MKRTTLEQLIGTLPDNASAEEEDAYAEREDALNETFAYADHKTDPDEMLDTIDEQLKEHGLEVEKITDTDGYQWRIVRRSE
jgi:hypothetical protein